MFPDFVKIQEDINDFIESTNKSLIEIITRLETIESKIETIQEVKENGK